MNKIDWYEHVKTDFDNMVDKYADDYFKGICENEEVYVRFEEFGKERSIDFGLVATNSSIGTLKYSESESHFYLEVVSAKCTCGNEECIYPGPKYRVIMDSEELLIAFIAHESIIAVEELELRIIKSVKAKTAVPLENNEGSDRILH